MDAMDAQPRATTRNHAQARTHPMRWWRRCLEQINRTQLTRTHLVVLIGLGLVMPLASRLIGSGELAYGMYAHAEEYRLDVLATDDAGHRRAIAPTDLAEGTRASVVPLLAGADHWRTTPRTNDLRIALPALALHACEIERATDKHRPGSVISSIHITLHERAWGSDVVRTTTTAATCPP